MALLGEHVEQLRNLVLSCSLFLLSIACFLPMMDLSACQPDVLRLIPSVFKHLSLLSVVLGGVLEHRS